MMVTEYSSLHNVRLERLSLPAPTIRALQRAAIMTVGDCIEFFIRDRVNAYPDDPSVRAEDLIAQTRSAYQVPLPVLMYRDVKPLLQARGDWQSVEQADLVGHLEERQRRIRLVLKAPADHYMASPVPIASLSFDSLRLSQAASEALKGDQLALIGGQLVLTHWAERGEANRDVINRLRPHVAELEQKVKEQRYWTFVDALIDQADMFPEGYHPLFYISIEMLALSDAAMTALKADGLTSVGDCVVFYYLDAHDRGCFSPALRPVMYTEVKERLIAQDYWLFVMDADVWRILKGYAHEIRMRMIFKRIGYAQDHKLSLFDVPIEVLDLSVRACNTLKHRGISAIGDCIVCCMHGLQGAMRTPDPEEMIAEFNSHVYSPWMGCFFVLFGEVQIKLRERGYWYFVEEHVTSFK